MKKYYGTKIYYIDFIENKKKLHFRCSVWPRTTQVWPPNEQYQRVKLKMHKYSYQMICNNRQSNSDYIIKTVTHLCGATLLSDAKKSAQHRLLFSIFLKIKWTKDQILTDTVWNFVKNKVHPLFFQRLVLEAIFIVWFLHRPAFASLVLHYICESVGGAKQALM